MLFDSYQLNRFAIRKFTVGVCSVLVAGVLFLGASGVRADDGETAASQPNSVLVVETGPETGSTAVMPITEPTSSALPSTVESQSVTAPSTPRSSTLPPSSVTEIETKTEVTVSAPEGNGQKVESEKSLPSAPTQSTPSESSASAPETTYTVTPEPPARRSSALPRTAPVKLTEGTSLRAASRTSTVGVIGDDYPDKWRSLDPNYNTDDWRLYVKNCTSFAAYRLSSANGFELPLAYGNATLWGPHAQAEHYQVDQNPVRGAIAWSTASADNDGYGHVAWVASVEGDMVTVEEYNYGNRYGYNVRTVHKSAFSGFIHFKDIMGVTSTSKPVYQPSSTQQLPAQGTYTFTQRSSVKSQAKVSSPALDYYNIGETVRYDKVLEADNHLWLSYINFKGSRSYVDVKELTPLKTAGSIIVQNKNAQTGNFDVVISGVAHAKAVQSIQVPIWSDNGGQDDIVWYQAQPQADQTFKVSVDVSKHKGDTGIYHIHLYYQEVEGQQVGVGGTTTSVEKTVPTSTIAIAPSGTYRFTTTLPIKNQASMASATIDYYYAGETVNYDRVLTAEGRQWLSYLSRSGARRYIPLN